MAVLGARLVILAALILCACSPPPASSPQPNATVEALSAQVEALSAALTQVKPSPEPPASRVPLPSPSSTLLATEVVASLAAVVSESAADPEPEATPTPEPTAEPTPTLVPTPFPTRTVRPTSVADSQPCRVGQIKGNKSSHIYHVPGGASYPRTVTNVQCFDTEDQALAAGYRKARN